MIATIVIGLAVPAILMLVGATTTQNSQSQQYTTALMLANQVREMMSGLPFNDPVYGSHLGVQDPGENTIADYNDVQDFDGKSYNLPVDANRQTISGMDNWRQSISVQLVGDSQGAQLETVTGNSAAIVERVRVTVSYRSAASAAWATVLTTSWLKTRY